jgi:hypothetical protein
VWGVGGGHAAARVANSGGGGVTLSSSPTHTGTPNAPQTARDTVARSLLDATLPQVLCRSWSAQVVLQTVSLEAGCRRGGAGAGRR